MEYEAILIEPVLTEKTNDMRDKSMYVFNVDPRANKTQIMEAVRKMFNVHPVSCKVINVGGKLRRVRTRYGYTSSWKKAIVRLQRDEKIAIFEGV